MIVKQENFIFGKLEKNKQTKCNVRVRVFPSLWCWRRKEERDGKIHYPLYFLIFISLATQQRAKRRCLVMTSDRRKKNFAYHFFCVLLSNEKKFFSFLNLKYFFTNQHIKNKQLLSF